ncbi:MAG: TPM domain-containing protein [Piscinibacter sp.]|nr:TPM domain-containing protein [Piscinibacter sp.]
MRLLAAWLAAALLLGAAALARAQDVLPVPPLSGRVIDQTGTLGAAQQQALSDKLAAIEAKRGSQIVVLLVPSTQPEDIASYSQRVADAWKIGRLAVGDGLVIVVAKDDRRVRIEVAKALEGAVPDLMAKRVISEVITPAFRAGDFAGGLNAAVDRLDGLIGGEGLPEPGHRGANQGERGFDLQDLPIFLFVAVPIIGTVLTSIMGRKLGALATAGAAGGMGWWLTASLLAAFGAGVVALILVALMGGRMGRHGGGSHGGPVIWGGGGGGGGWSSGDSGGGFSSGGGGDFGGGGASGDW